MFRLRHIFGDLSFLFDAVFLIHKNVSCLLCFSYEPLRGDIVSPNSLAGRTLASTYHCTDQHMLLGGFEFCSYLTGNLGLVIFRPEHVDPLLGMIAPG